MSSTSHLVKMANQIAASVPDRAHASRDTAQHLARFWTPAMIDDLASYARSHPDDLEADARTALASLRQEVPHD